MPALIAEYPPRLADSAVKYVRNSSLLLSSKRK